MSEIEALLTRAAESLAAARILLKDGFPDFAASRAYYALFYVEG
ncbi:MAG: HEPN domain-containing protein [Candidatus Hydrogenedentes bacterium]|nr:HEPN domain-containing protein [Candidatus Hydrogenedentota bacterium]